MKRRSMSIYDNRWVSQLDLRHTHIPAMPSLNEIISVTIRRRHKVREPLRQRL